MAGSRLPCRTEVSTPTLDLLASSPLLKHLKLLGMLKRYFLCKLYVFPPSIIETEQSGIVVCFAKFSHLAKERHSCFFLYVSALNLL